MSKYLNIILLSLLGILGIKMNLGLTLFIPFVYFYTYKNVKNLMLIIPITFISCYIFNINNYIILVLLFIPLIIYIFIKDKKQTYILISSFSTNIITLYLYKLINHIEGNIYLEITLIILSFFMLFYMLNNTNKDKYINNDILLGFSLTISTINYKLFDINITLLVSIYFAMLYSSNKDIIKSIIYSIICSIILHYIYQIDHTYILLITSLIYYIPNLLSSIIYMLLCIYTLFLYPELIDKSLYIAIAIIVLLFEVFRKTITQYVAEDNIITNLYITDINQIEVELDSFSLFLDNINNNNIDNKYMDDINKKVEKVVSEFCFKCEKRDECFRKNKGKLYYFFKSNILGIENDLICEYGDNLRRYSRNLGNNLIDKKAYISDIIKPILDGISSILKQYKIDKNEKKEINIKKLLKLKKALIENGYTISIYNVLKNFEDDFIIEIGLIGISLVKEKVNLEYICSKHLGIKTTINQKYSKNNKIYLLAIPKNNYEILYGYGSISKVGNSICGDNYLIKNLSNKKMVAVICDGMGKGLNANVISSRTLKLLDDITNTNMNSETCLHILNTLYYIQDYQESFTTIDFIEVDKHTGEMILYKAGAAKTYIIHNDNIIEKIENESLPFGLNEMVISKKIQLQNNDLIILASDGIFDNIIDVNEFENFILSNKNIEPQKLAYEILNYARKVDLISKDDMSVIALKVKNI